VNALTNSYLSADDRWFMLAARQSAWPALANAIGRSDLLDDPRFADGKAIAQHGAELAKVLDAEFSSQPLEHWKEILDQARVPYGVIQTPEETAVDPQLRAADIVVPIEGAADLDYTVNNPITLRGLTRVPARRAPEHGEHNDEVLAQLGFSTDEIDQMREQKVIPAAPEQETAR
jgi:formyl-CoA transferase